tara:strand:+ start:523 stop:744 length:222 start_codon:yes stop_codon:yes gene_type:complete
MNYFLILTKSPLFLKIENLPLLNKLKSLYEEAISDSKVVNSTIFLQKTLPYFAGQNNILEEQKNVFILIFQSN